MDLYSDVFQVGNKFFVMTYSDAFDVENGKYRRSLDTLIELMFDLKKQKLVIDKVIKLNSDGYYKQFVVNDKSIHAFNLKDFKIHSFNYN